MLSLFQYKNGGAIIMKIKDLLQGNESGPLPIKGMQWLFLT